MRVLVSAVLAIGLGGCTEPDSGFGGSDKADEAEGSSKTKSPPLGKYSLSHAPSAGNLVSLELRPLSDNFVRYTGEYTATQMTDSGEVTITGPYRVYRRRIKFTQPAEHLRTVPLMALFNENEERIERWIVTDLTESGFIALSNLDDGAISSEFFLDFVAGGSGQVARNIECELKELIDDNVFEEGLGEDNDATGVSVFQNPATAVIEVDIGDHSWSSDDEDLTSVKISDQAGTTTVLSDFGDGDEIRLVVTGTEGRVEAKLDGATEFAAVATLICE